MILVDPPMYHDSQRTKLRYEWWSHMVSDLSVDELHDFAHRLGLKRSWFQPRKHLPHYDITANKREQAIRLGAVPVSSRDLVQRSI